MLIYGKQLTRRQIEERVANTEQLFGLQRAQLAEGPEAGVDMVRVRTGGGLTFYVSLSRGMDISLAEYRGVPLSWHSGNGDVHPAFYNVYRKEWLRTVAGGLLFTCGLSQVGAPCEDDGVYYGQHGRIHHIPARLVSLHADWAGDEYEMAIEGKLEETSLFGEHLRMTRRIECRAGTNKFVLRDTVENVGFVDQQIMILYHFNLGYPFVDENVTVDAPSSKVTPQVSDMPLEDYGKFQLPEAGYGQRVYYHELKKASRAEVVVTNPAFPSEAGRTPLRATIGWSTDNLPNLVHWKMPAAGTYVLGIEPSNCLVEGRIVEREKGRPVYLAPGGAIRYEVEFAVN